MARTLRIALLSVLTTIGLSTAGLTAHAATAVEYGLLVGLIAVN